jgi:predicted class III extradiol MEMO1 family dioxygenase
MNRIKQMTVQQLVDMGFRVDVHKFYCGAGNTSVMLEAKQLLESPEFYTNDDYSTVWATQKDEVLKVTFFGD